MPNKVATKSPKALVLFVWLVGFSYLVLFTLWSSQNTFLLPLTQKVENNVICNGQGKGYSKE